MAIYAETLDTSYTTAEDYCADYYALRVDEIEEAVVANYVANSRRVDAVSYTHLTLPTKA